MAEKNRIIDILLFTFLKTALWLRYRLRLKNMPRPDGRPILFLPNHPALIDPVIMYRVLGPAFHPRPLVDATQAARPVVRQALKHINAIIIADAVRVGQRAKQEVEASLSQVAHALEQGDNVMFYPAGHINRAARESVGGNSGLKVVLSQMPVLPRLVLVRTTGLWGSAFSRASGEYPKVGKIIEMGIKALLANFIVFIPRRKLTLEFSEPEEFAALAAGGDKKAINQYLDDFYNQDTPPAFRVPLYFWQGGRPLPMPEPQVKTGASLAIPASIQDAVFAYLRRLSGQQQIKPEQLLSADLGLDSLSVVEISLWLEDEFGFSVPNLENLASVQDCLEAAMGLSGGQDSSPGRPIATNWFPGKREQEAKLTMPEAPLQAGQSMPSLASLFLAKARRSPKRPLMADRASGVRTFGQTLTAIEALLPGFCKIANQRLGIMLPLSPAVVISWLAVLLAGKTPVMVNWTVGMANLRHCLGLSQVDTVITARALVERLDRQGFALSQLAWPDGRKVNFIYLEDMAAALSPPARIAAWWRARFSRRLDKLAASERMSSIAAILFTSGSETLPKAVPLSHANLLSNLLDAIKVLDLRHSDRLLGLLPPFHSLGLLGNMVLPACLGMPMACHPNPTEARSLVRLVKDYRLSLLVTPPTFLDNMLRRAQGSTDLASLRLAFVGAEKCPDRVFRQFSEQCPNGVLCEGYGVSECSPVVSLNRPDDPHPGTIGRVLDSMHSVVLAGPQTNPRLSGYSAAETGQPGLLLVRGPNVFAGYLPAPAGYDAPPSPFMDFAGQTFYNTGDLVSRDESGILTFQGRLKRFVKIGGEMISLPQIEEVLCRAFPAPANAPEGPWLAVEAAGPDSLITLFTTIDISREAANGALHGSGLSGLYNIRQVVRLKEMPLLGTGKTDYRGLSAYGQRHALDHNG